MSGPSTFEVSSVVAAARPDVWARITSIDGINGELMPLFRMTHPPHMKDLSTVDVVPGRRIFRSWVLLFGVLPVDYDDLTLTRLTPGIGFREQSPMLSQRLWIHERTLEDVPGGCRVTDRITYEPRFAWLAPVYRAVLPRVFAHRHRRLRRYFADGAQSMP